MLNPKTKKLIRENLNFDKVTFKADGTVEFKDAYFYRHGRTPDLLAEKVKRGLEKVGLTATTVEVADKWAAWPKTSYMVAVMKVEQ